MTAESNLSLAMKVCGIIFIFAVAVSIYCSNIKINNIYIYIYDTLFTHTNIKYYQHLIQPFLYIVKSGWAWNPNQYEYEWMIIGTYAVLGYYLYKGSSDLPGSKLLLEFTIWGACFMHGTVMAYETIIDWEDEWAHMMPWGDVTALYIFAALLYYLKSQVDFKSS